MAKEESIKTTGTIQEVLPNTMFRVKLLNEHIIMATISGKLRQHNIRIGQGDEVEIEMSPYDLNRGRIVYRNK